MHKTQTMNNRIKKIEDDEEIELTDQDASAEHAQEEGEGGAAASANPTGQNSKPKKSAGEVLKNERLRQGLTLEIVHETTKIPLDALRAIEEGYKIRMLSPFYYKGFVKMYAKYLSVDISEVLDDYKKEELPEHIDDEIQEFTLPQWVTGTFTKQLKQKIVIGIGAVLVLFALFKLIGFIASIRPKAPVRPPENKVAKKEIKKAALAVEQTVINDTPKLHAQIATPKITPPPIPKPAPHPVQKAEPKTQPTVVPQKPEEATPARASALSAKKIHLTVRANENSWLRVKTDGNIVFQSILRMGAVETWLADKEIEISGRNINELEFELNGKLIGKLGRQDRHAKKVIIRQNGLSVEK